MSDTARRKGVADKLREYEGWGSSCITRELGEALDGERPPCAGIGCRRCSTASIARLADMIGSCAGRTCSIEWIDGGIEWEGHYHCTSCGENLPRWADVAWDDYQAARFEGEPPFRHCPICGATVACGDGHEGSE